MYLIRVNIVVGSLLSKLLVIMLIQLHKREHDELDSLSIPATFI